MTFETDGLGRNPDGTRPKRRSGIPEKLLVSRCRLVSREQKDLAVEIIEAEIRSAQREVLLA